MAWEPWKPTLKQERFLSLPWSIKEGFYAGAAGAGKSDVLLMYPIVFQWTDDPNFKGLFLRRTTDELREEIIPRSINKLDFRRYGGTYNKAFNYWQFESGAMFFFGHCQFEDDVHKYDTAQWNYIAFDELTSFTEFQYIYLTFERVRRDKNAPHLPAIVRSASNPGNIGHAWVRKRFIDPARNGMVVIDGRGGNKRIFIPATLADNPHIDPEYNRSLDALPEAERQAKKFGSWDAYSGQVFDEFRDKHHSDEPDNALHVVEPFDIPDWWPKIVAIDWGYNAMTWVGYGAISPTRRLYLYREQAWSHTKIEEWAAHVRVHVERENPRIVKLCKSAGQDRGQEHTILQQVTDALGRPVDLTQNNAGSRVAGKLLLHEYFRWKHKFVPAQEIEEYSHEQAMWLLRNFGDSHYQKYLARFTQPEIETNIPRLQIFKQSPEGVPITLVIDAIKACAYEKSTDGKKPEDVAEFDGDDPYDGLRYLVDAADKYFGEAESEFAKIQKRDELTREFKETQDYNLLFRKAKALEAVNKPVRAISRYRHGIR